MINPSKPQAIVAVIISAIIFTISLAVFCYALGLDFANEGWSSPPSGESFVAQRQGSLWLSMVGFAVSIVLFFIGLHRIAKTD